MENNVKIDKQSLKEVVDNSPSVAEAIINLYKKVVVEFDEMEKVSPPKCNFKTAEQLIGLLKDMFQDDKNKTLILWLNYGFSVDDTINDDFTFTYIT